MAKSSKSTIRWSDGELNKNLILNPALKIAADFKPSVRVSSMREALQELGVSPNQFKRVPKKVTRKKESTEIEVIPIIDGGITKKTTKKLTDVEAKKNAGPKIKKKRQGVDVKPIIQSIVDSTTSVDLSYHPQGFILSVWFEGARLLTVNELFAIMQYRKFEVYKYKAEWKRRINTILDVLHQQGMTKPIFDGPTRLYLYRRGAKAIDLDSFQTAFKYAIDGLRVAGLISDDNPNIIVETVPIQQMGEPAIGMRLERLTGWQFPLIEDYYKDWFS